jgi:hypothetical protein
MPVHSGDGGWRPPAAALSASRSARGQYTSLASLSGAGLERLSARAAATLLAALLTNPRPARRQGMTDLGSKRPPPSLLYVLLSDTPGQPARVAQQ